MMTGVRNSFRAVSLCLIASSIWRDVLNLESNSFCSADKSSEKSSRQMHSTDRFSDVPVYSYVKAEGEDHRRLTTLPLGLHHHSQDEGKYLKLHKCQDPGEVFSASYLITKEHLMYQYTGTWK